LAFLVPLELALEEKGQVREMAMVGALFLSCSCRQSYPIHPLVLSAPLELSSAVQRALAILKRWECVVFDAVVVQDRSQSLMLWLRLPLKAILAEQDFSSWVFVWVVKFCPCHVEVLVWEGFLVAR
jgi:hypothetical protein